MKQAVLRKFETYTDITATSSTTLKAADFPLDLALLLLLER